MFIHLYTLMRLPVNGHLASRRTNSPIMEISRGINSDSDGRGTDNRFSSVVEMGTGSFGNPFYLCEGNAWVCGCPVEGETKRKIASNGVGRGSDADQPESRINKNTDSQLGADYMRHWESNMA